MLLQDNRINLVFQVAEQPAFPPAALPVIAYDDHMSCHFNGQQIDLFHYSEAHTTGDTAVIFRGDNAVHLGDVFNNSGYPLIDADNGGSLPGLIHFCEALLAEIDSGTVVIPSHGAVAGYERLQDCVETLSIIRDRIAALIDDGASLDEVIAARPTADFDASWGLFCRTRSRASCRCTGKIWPATKPVMAIGFARWPLRKHCVDRAMVMRC